MSGESKQPLLEYDRIRPGLERMGVNGDWRIVVPRDPDRVERTAAEVLRRLFRAASLKAAIVPEDQAGTGPRICLGRIADSGFIRRMDEAGILNIGGVSPDDDGFHVRRIGADIAVAGANPRGVLYGAYALEDHIRDGAAEPPDIRRVPHFRRRLNAQGYYFSPTVNLKTDEFTRDKAEYLSRIGANMYLSSDMCYNLNLRELVQSSVFPFQEPPDPEYRRKVQALSSILADYGIDYYHWVSEPNVVREEDAHKYPPGALGWVRRPWGGGKDGLERTLCVSSPVVREHYRDLMRKLVREFPDMKGVLFYNLDGNAWLCAPGMCPRCAAECPEPPEDPHKPWQTQADFVSLLALAARGERPDFGFDLWAAVHYHGEEARKLLLRAQGYDSLSVSWNGSDRDILIPEGASPGPEFYMTKAVAGERGVPLYAIHEFSRLESCQPGFPYPFHVCAVLKRYAGWGVQNLMEFGGPVPAHNGINAIAAHAFMRDPGADPVAFLRDLAARQFGAAAGERMYAAWERIRDALDVWNGYAIHPFSGSQAYLSLGTMMGVPDAVLPGVEEKYAYNIDIRVRVEGWRADAYRRLREEPFAAGMERMEGFLGMAAQHALEAYRAAGDSEFIGICGYAGSPEGLGRPTCREYAGLQYAAIAVSHLMCRQRAHILRAVLLLRGAKERRAAGDGTGACAMEERHRALVREDLALQERMAALLEELRSWRPCLSRVGVTQGELESFIAGTREKIEKLKDFIAGS